MRSIQFGGMNVGTVPGMRPRAQDDGKSFGNKDSNLGADKIARFVATPGAINRSLNTTI